MYVFYKSQKHVDAPKLTIINTNIHCVDEFNNLEFLWTII